MSHGFKNKKVLIVEDNPNMSSLLADILLQCFDLKSEKAKDGQEALDILKDEAFDLVITDLMMPKIDGKELLKTVKQNFPKLPVVLITGYEAEFNPEEEPRPDGFLLKPFKVQQIEELLRNLQNPKR
ncbi:MAG: response regulator [candidate division Zixibacteria bacterium]|nr:response regulator [candidate division Zixibacteria bacterium]